VLLERPPETKAKKPRNVSDYAIQAHGAEIAMNHYLFVKLKKLESVANPVISPS